MRQGSRPAVYRPLSVYSMEEHQPLNTSLTLLVRGIPGVFVI